VSDIPVFTARHVELAVPPEVAVEVVRRAFVAHARGEWTMPPKIYLTNYPAGDFRAMPALGGGHALLKWVTSFPGNPARGLPTVSGVVLLSNAETGELEALLDAGAVTALRTGAAAVLAAEALGRADVEMAAVIGAGVNGKAAARTLLVRGHRVMIWDIDGARALRVAEDLGATVARSREEALTAGIVVTVTSGHEVLFSEGSLCPGQHVSLMGADGPGKAEIATSELTRTRSVCGDQSPAHGVLERDPPIRLFCDDWEQASHSGDISRGVQSGQIVRDDVVQLGAVLAGQALGRRGPDEITIFDSTGLAIQDLAIAIACIERPVAIDIPRLELR
jgi:alanine dehydrogenase